MPVKGKLFVKNHEGNQLEGPNEEDKSSFIFEYDHQVYLPTDIEDSRVQGARRISVFSVVKDVDKLTPQLYDIVCNGRKCTEVLIKLFRIHADTGEEEEYFHYLLEEAKVVSVDNYMPFTKNKANEDLGHLEKVKFLSRKFTWKFLAGGIEYTEEAMK